MKYDVICAITLLAVAIAPCRANTDGSHKGRVSTKVFHNWEQSFANRLKEHFKQSGTFEGNRLRIKIETEIDDDGHFRRISATEKSSNAFFNLKALESVIYFDRDSANARFLKNAHLSSVRETISLKICKTNMHSPVRVSIAQDSGISQQL